MKSQILEKEISLLSVIAVSLATILAYGIVKNDAVSLFMSLAAILASSIIMLLYWFVRRNILCSTERWSILLSVIAWLGLFYYLLHINGLAIWSYF